MQKLESYSMSKTTKTLIWVSIFIGVLSFFIGWRVNSERIWHSYLVSYWYFLSLSLGGLFFLAVNYVTSAKWMVSFRRIPESFTSYLPIAVVSTAVLLLGANELYSWLDPKVVETDALVKAKVAYLNRSFFSIRAIVFFALWLFFGWKLVNNSLKNDETGDSNLLRKNLGLSVAFILVFALSYSLWSVDALKSLDPHWFSTMWGVYTFSGLFQSMLAMMALFCIFLMSEGKFRNMVTVEHVHDIAKFMFAFTVFYAYIGFSQFMLIWYANLPEETMWFMHRAHGGWFYISIALVLFKFVVPFLALAPQPAKRNLSHVRNVAVLILATQYMDNYWIVYPQYREEPVFGFWEVGIFLGFLGLFLLSVHKFLEKNNLVPIKDPRLEESAHHHVH